MPKVRCILPPSTRLLVQLCVRRYKVDGVTRCLARLLAHLKEEGPSVVVLGPSTNLVGVGILRLTDDVFARLPMHHFP